MKSHLSNVRLNVCAIRTLLRKSCFYPNGFKHIPYSLSDSEHQVYIEMLDQTVKNILKFYVEMRRNQDNLNIPNTTNTTSISISITSTGLTSTSITSITTASTTTTCYYWRYHHDKFYVLLESFSKENNMKMASDGHMDQCNRTDVPHISLHSQTAGFRQRRHTSKRRQYLH